MPGPLDQLPDEVAELSATVPAAAKAIAGASADRWFRPVRGSDSYQLESARLEWRFFFERRDTWSFFLFRKANSFVPVDARLSTLARPAEAAPAAMEAVDLALGFPPFVWMRPSPEDLAQFAPAGSSPDNAILFRLGKAGGDILGVRTDRKRLRFTRAGAAPSDEPRGGSFALEPFLMLAGALDDWFAAGMPTEEQHVAAPEAGSGSGPAREVIDRVAEAWRRGHNALANADAPPNPFHAVHWRAAAFRSDIQIRFDEKGRLARKPADERFSMLLRMTGEGGRSRMHVRAAPGTPAAGVSKAVLDHFQFVPDGSRALGRALERLGAGGPAFVPSFIESARDRARMLLLEKDDDARWYLLILPGELLGREATVIAIAPMIVDELANPPSAGSNLDFDVAVLADPFADPMAARSSDVHVERLLAWVGNFRRWMELVQ